MAIKVQESLVGGSNYPVTESSQIRGGLVTIDTTDELQDIPKHLLVEGQHVYAKSTDQFFVYKTIDGVSGFALESYDRVENPLYVGELEPMDKNAVWFYPTSNKNDIKDPLIKSMHDDLTWVKKAVRTLLYLRTQGIISGTLNDSALTEISEMVLPKKPDVLKEDDEEEDDDGLDYTARPKTETESGKTVNHVTIKAGTYEEIENAYRIGNIIDKEMVWSTDRLKMYLPYNGILYPIGNSSTNNNDNTDDTDMTNEQLQAYLDELKTIGFKPLNNDNVTYNVKVDEHGKLIVYNKDLDDYADTPGDESLYFIFDNEKNITYGALYINSFYLGGLDNDKHSLQPCSHNFVELANISNRDIDLNGISLFYTASSNSGSWKSIRLWGTVPARSTFLIRGAQCSSMDANTTYLKVNTYDMEWYEKSNNTETDSTSEPEDGVADNRIKFTQGDATFYLAWADKDNKIYTKSSKDNTVDINMVGSGKDLYDKENNITPAKGYIHLVGVGAKPFAFENSTISFDSISGYDASSVTKSVSKVLFTRWYSLDPVSQSNKVFSKSTEIGYWKMVELTPYIEKDISIYTPKASFEGKNHSTDKHKFMVDVPNCFTFNFGIQATDNGSGATRGFTWTSVGYYDEGLFIRKQGTNTWTFIESIKENQSPKEIEGFSYPACITDPSTKKYYERIRWETYYKDVVTTHKLLVTMPHGIYEICVGRPDENNQPSEYISDIRTMKVKSYDEVKAGFDWIQTSDQQGANWEEYQVWALSAAFIKYSEAYKEYDFTINTGDICYNGSRPCEWIDYYEGYQKYLGNYAENFCIGNNDLAPTLMRYLGNGNEQPYKINHIVADLFYTIEMDTKNLPIFTGLDLNYDIEEAVPKQYRVPCLYSFNYGDYHFVCLNSEIRTGSNKATGASTAPNTVTGIFGVHDLRVKDINGKDIDNESIIYENIAKWLLRDTLLWKNPDINIEDFSMNATNWETWLADSTINEQCEKMIVYTHEMPFNIVSSSIYEGYARGNTGPRETAKASLNRHFNFKFQRIFKILGVRMVCGGHKHTCSISYPVYDAPFFPIGDSYDVAKDAKAYNPIDDNSIDRLLSTPEDEKNHSKNYSFTACPIMQLKVVEDPGSSGSEKQQLEYSHFASILAGYCRGIVDKFNNIECALGVGTIYNNTDKSIVLPMRDTEGNPITINPKSSYTPTVTSSLFRPVVRLELVDKVTAPSYIMCHATGFKNVSNSELAADMSTNKWLRNFVPNGEAEQRAPFYNRYFCGPDGIKVQMIRIGDMYTAAKSDGSVIKKGYWDFNKFVMKPIKEDGKSMTYDEARYDLAKKYKKQIWTTTYNSDGTIQSWAENNNSEYSYEIKF